MVRGGGWRWLIVCGVLGACGGSPREAAAPSVSAAERVRALAAEYAREYAQAFPELAEYYGHAVARHDTLSDNSLPGLAAWRAREDAWLRRLRAINATELRGSDAWAIHARLRETLESSIGGRVCRAELWPAHQFGWQTTLLAVLTNQPLDTPAAHTAALTRFRQLPRYLQTEIANLREGLRLGYSVPRRNAELALAQIDALLQTPTDTSPLFGPRRRVTDAAFQNAWVTLATDSLLPAITRYRDFLRDEYAPRARATLAISELPNGAACYRSQIRVFTTTRLDPATIYERGQARVSEREAKALALANKLYGVADLRAAKAAVEADPRNRFASREQVLEFVRAAFDRARSAAPRWFGSMPRGELELVPYDDFEAKARPGARYEPVSADGSIPARYRIDVTHFDTLERLDLELTTFHEGIPGHHLQLGLEREQKSERDRGDPAGLPAFNEGWARYAETLADEMGLYSSDLDRLGATAHLPTGLVVDPGIHAFGWTRERAISWSLEKQVAFSPEDAAAYVDRIAVTPGQMLSYGTGELEFVSLRREAEAALGAKFDIKEFHDQVLAHGTIPLPVLREIVEEWIRRSSRPTQVGSTKR
jgi:uncharacterized protein (DUF885 family)